MAGKAAGAAGKTSGAASGKATGGAASGKATEGNETAPAGRTGRRGELVLRSSCPPVNQLDFDDRHDTRATETEEMSKRYADLRKEYRKDDWHRLAQGLVVFVVGVVVYLVGVILVSRLLPQLTPQEAAKIVGLAYAAAGGGVAVRWGGRALKQRYERRKGSDPT